MATATRVPVFLLFGEIFVNIHSEGDKDFSSINKTT